MTAPVPESGPQQPLTLADWFFAACIASGWEAGLTTARSEAIAAHFWPLAWHKAKGIPMGEQWHVLGWLAARYARDFDIAGLADELAEVMHASAQDSRRPWTRRHAVDIAARAKRFTDREDAAQERRDASFWAYLHASGFLAWAEATLARTPWHGGARRPGIRSAAARRAGVRT